MTEHYKIELESSWLSFNIGHLSAAAVAAICGGGEDFDDTIYSDTGYAPESDMDYSKRNFINIGRCLKDVSLNRGGLKLKDIKISNKKRNIKVGKANVLIIPLEFDESHEEEYLNSIGIVSLEQAAGQIADRSVRTKINSIYREHVALRKKLWKRSKSGESVFVFATCEAGCIEAEGHADGDLLPDDVKFIFFAEYPVLYKGGQIDEANEDMFPPMGGLYLAAIVFKNKLIDFYYDSVKGNAVYRHIVTYAHDQAPQVVFSE